MKSPLIFAAFALLFFPTLLAQDAPPAFDRSEPENGAEQPYDPFDPTIHAPKMVRIQTEFIEMGHKDASRLLMEDEAKTFDATKLRMKVQKMVDGDNARILDTTVIHARSGEKATAESIAETIYPTEYMPIPLRSSEEKKKETPSPAAPLPTAFETRNVGSTLEIEPTIGEDDKMVNLRFVPELTWHTGNSTWQEYKDRDGTINKVEMPDFYTLRLNTAFTCISGHYCFAAVLSPKDNKGNLDHDRKVMVFVRCVVLPVVP